jgi:iron complex outermembrane receptor protein
MFRSIIGATALSLAALTTFNAQAAIAQTTTPDLSQGPLAVNRRFDVPSLPLNEALITISRQVGVTLIFTGPPGGQWRRSPRVHGVMTGAEAFRSALLSSNLELVQLGPTTYTIRARVSRRVSAPPMVRPTLPAVPDVLDEVVVTGARRLSTTALTSVANVEVVHVEELTSRNTTGELVTTLSDLSPSIDAPRSTLNGTPEAVRNIRFRGLNPDQVLVLVNGQRRHASAVVHASSIYRGAAGVDINAIPAIGIQRVEILRDGAAAQYGSDAVTGVINFILKDQAQGGELGLVIGGYVSHVPATGSDVVDGLSSVISGDQGYALGAEGFVRLGAELILRGETDRAGFDQIPSFVRLPADSSLRGRRNYHLGDGDLTNLNLYTTFGSGPLGRDVSIYGDATLGIRRSESAYFFRYPGTLTTSDDLYPSGFRPLAVGNNFNFSSSIGVRQKLAKSRWEVVASGGFNSFENRLENTLNASLGVASPTAFRIGELSYGQLNLQAIADLEISERTTLTFGADGRYERHAVVAGDPAAYQIGPFTDRDIGAQGGGVITPTDAGERSRTSVSAFTALEMAASENLSLVAAARVENANDYGTALSGRVGTNLSLGSFVFRASGSRNYRAPNIGQLNYSVTNTDFSPDLRLVSQLNLGGDNPLLPVFGFGNLRPEISSNWTLGSGFRQGDFQATADAYIIRISDRIGTTPLITADAAVAAASDLIGSRIESVRFPINRYDTETAGIDLAASVMWDVLGGELVLRGALSLVETTIKQITPIPERLRRLSPNLNWNGLNAEFGSVPTSQFEGQANFRTEHYDISWRTTRYGKSEEPRRGATSGVQVYAPDWRHDVSLAWRPVTGLEARIGADNLFDTYPDETVGVESYFGNFPYGYARPIGINGRYIFASLRKYW